MMWVVVSNSNQYKIFNFKGNSELTLIKKTQHPENKLKRSDIVSDRPGHAKGSGVYGSSYYEYPTDPKEVLFDELARELCHILDEGRLKNQYEKLIIIAPPKTFGAISNHLNKHIEKLVRNHIKKDLVHLTDHELLDFLKTNAQFPT